MSHSKPCLVLALLMILSHGSVRPQTPVALPESSPALTGTVTGSVYDEGTHLPVRFAAINFVPIPSQADVAPGNRPTTSGKPQQRVRAVQRVEGASGMDGSFRLNVPEGDYFVEALKPGYINPGAAAATDFSLSEDQLKSLVASLSQVHVDAGGIASVSLTLHRGAVITGRIRYADGSPAIGVAVGCEAIDSAEHLERALSSGDRGKVPSPLQQALISLASQDLSQKLTTDDQGRYRIFGLSAGKYLVSTIMFMTHSAGRVVMNDGSMGWQNQFPEMVSVYAPATFRRKDAKVFEIHGDEQVSDADLTVDPSGVHTLKGRLLAADDHLSSSTMIRLKEAGTKALASRLVGIEVDGTFQIDYLPAGSYTLLISAFGDQDPATPSVQSAEYKWVELTAVIAGQDVLLNDVLLVPLKPGEHNDFSKLFEF